MRALVAVFSFLLVIVLSGVASAANSFNGESFNGFVQVRKDRELYVDYLKPKPGMPTVILLNGLTYSTTQWNRFVGEMGQKGVGILRYDMYGMGRTLLKYAPATAMISYTDQVSDLKSLLSVLNLQRPYNLAGLSYGAGIGIAYALAFPQDVKNLILMAPYTEPLETQYNWIMTQIRMTRLMFPMNPYSDDELYDYFLHQTVYATYPMAEPVVMQNPYILEGVFRMVQGIRKYRPIDEAKNLAVPVHLMVAEYDQYVPAKTVAAFWEKVPSAAKASCGIVRNSEHKIPEAQPKAAADWVFDILQGNKHGPTVCQ